MLLCHSILRSKLQNYTLKTLGQSEEYLNLLHLINDNLDGHQGALSIQNIARMALVFDKFPGEWHSQPSICQVMSHLLKIYKPVQNFTMCYFNEGIIY